MKFWIRSYSISVNTPDWPTLKARLTQRFAEGRGFAIATLNMDHLVKLETSAVFQHAYNDHDIVVADGNPIVWMSHLASNPVELLPGSDLIFPIARLCAELDMPIGLIGSREASLNRAAMALREAVPNLKIVYQSAPTMGFNPSGPEAESILKAAQGSGARLCFLALGAPKQEVFAAYGRNMLPRMGFASIGAGLDFLSGDQQRAPLWVRKIAMEWLWRMLSNPGRMLGRYLRGFVVLPGHMIRSVVKSQD
ncbi:WecB/TagA/CpsF family glycosyltransferase [Thalassobius sp. MITS945101]|uniref:WecB/TagA/CpsF family glycosyltransferase n=1 Tax=Thalassobius sp. MITS945101 TaxID=3096994 RepID=UPI00399ADC17